MKKIFILIIILIISNILLYFHFHSELDKTNQSITALNREMATSKTDYTVQLQDFYAELKMIAANISQVQSEVQKRIGALMSDLISLKNNINNSRYELSRKYDALNIQWQAKNESVSSMINEKNDFFY